MAVITPLTQAFPIVDANGNFTPESKRFLDALLNRAGWITGGKIGQLEDAPTVVWDVDRYPHAVVVLGGNRTLADPVNAVAGSLWTYKLTVVQDSVGGRTLGWGGAYKFAGGVPVVVSTAANAVDEFWFSYDGSNMKLIAGGFDFQ